MRTGLVLAVLAGWIAALLTWTTPQHLHAPDPADTVAVLVLDNGFHTDMAVPRQALMQRGGPLAQAVSTLAPGDWILIGWGDARFYVEQGPIAQRLPDGARAFFRPGNPSVVMLNPESQDPRSRYAADERAPLRLSHADFDRMATRIEASLDLSGGAARVAASRPGDDARFFASHETFSILHLCNHWTASVLRAGGVSVRPVRSITSGEVMRAVRAVKLDTAAPRD